MGKTLIPREDFEELKEMAKKHIASGYKIEKLTKKIALQKTTLTRCVPQQKKHPIQQF